MRLGLRSLALAFLVPAYVAQDTCSQQEGREEACPVSSMSMLAKRTQKGTSTGREAHQSTQESLCEAAAPSLEKVRAIVRDLQSKGELSHGALAVAAEMVLGKGVGEEVLQAIQQIMNTVDLREATDTGDVVTMGDIEKIVACELNRPDAETEMNSHEGEETENATGISVLSYEEWPVFGGSYLWKSGQVPWCYVSCGAACQSAWESGIAEIMQQVPGVSFEKVATADGDCATVPSIRVISGRGCYSGIGPKWWSEASTELSLGQGCEFKSIAMHEALHALGLHHEQARSDRDEYVTINWENIIRGYESNFRIDRDSDTGSLYDILSIMHYTSKAFASNGQPTIVPKDPSNAKFLGNSMGLSELDAKMLCKMYNCSSTCNPLVKDEEQLQELLGVARTEQGCACQRTWSQPTSQATCATEENQGCCATYKRTWCFTQHDCGTPSGDGAWDYCTPRGKLKTKSGCVCQTSWERGTTTCSENMGCCGPAGNTWCKVEGEYCGHAHGDYRWDLCTPT